MGFDPTHYLSTHGWKGPGNGLTPSSRAKPITALQKKNHFGIGKERETSHPWWDDLFSQIATKLDKPKQATPPAPASALNLQAIQRAKQNAGKAELYRRFLRGKTIEGTIPDDDPPKEQELEIERSHNQQSASKLGLKSDDPSPEDETNPDQKKKKKKKSNPSAAEDERKPSRKKSDPSSENDEVKSTKKRDRSAEQPTSEPTTPDSKKRKKNKERAEPTCTPSKKQKTKKASQTTLDRDTPDDPKMGTTDSADSTKIKQKKKKKKKKREAAQANSL